MDINSRIAGRLQALRKHSGYSLDVLAERSGVSRSMISLIERGETSPTAVVLDKLAAALGVTLAGLFAEAAADTPDPLVRLAEQVSWQDPASGYIRRNVSPPGYPSSIELVEVVFPPGQRVAFDTLTRAADTHEQIWVLAGSIQISRLGNADWTLHTGDCLALRLDRPIVFHNPGPQQARYLVALNATAARVF